MPRPDLERELFQLFDEKAYWQITEIVRSRLDLSHLEY